MGRLKKSQEMEPRLNTKMLIVYQPLDRSKHDNKRRFYVGIYSLHLYIGHSNVKSVLRRAQKPDRDKVRVRLRKHGIIDIYFK